MKIGLVIIIGFIAVQGGTCQKSNGEKSSWLVGWQPSWAYIDIVTTSANPGGESLLLLGSNIHIGYFATKRWATGLILGYSGKISGNLSGFPETYNAYRAGYFFRFYPIEGKRQWGGESVFCNKCVTYRIRPYFQIGHVLTNAKIKEGRNVSLDHLGVHKVRLETGLGLRLRKNLFMNLGFGWRYSFNNDSRFGYFNVNSFEYHFGYHKRPENQNRKGCNATTIGAILECWDKTHRVEMPRRKGILIGSSLTYIPNDVLAPGQSGTYHEYSWSINAVTFLGQRLRAGVNTIQVFTNAAQVKKERYFLFGGLLQYAPVLLEKQALLLESGLMFGDYCTCGDGDPYRKAGIVYADIGVAYERALGKRLSLDLGLNFYHPISKTDEGYTFTQYIIGLNYFIGKK